MLNKNPIKITQTQFKSSINLIKNLHTKKARKYIKIANLTRNHIIKMTSSLKDFIKIKITLKKKEITMILKRKYIIMKKKKNHKKNTEMRKHIKNLQINIKIIKDKEEGKVEVEAEEVTMQIKNLIIRTTMRVMTTIIQIKV